jgi:hypothetical protein
VRKILVLEGEAYGQAAPDGGPLRARRLEKFGRLELLQILNDQPPYWFVMIRNFDSKRDLAPGMKGDSSGPRRQEQLIAPSKNGNWRFTDLEMAKAKFALLSVLPWAIADEAKRQELREKQKQRILAAGLPFPKKTESVIASASG